jgi:hypothetical protein
MKQMKKLIPLLFLLLSLNLFAQYSSTESNWNIATNEQMTLNYELLGRNTAQGAFYGAAGYGTGMWLSGNRTGWGVVGSVLAANIPILIGGEYKDPEAIIGRNLGALSFSLAATFYIETNRKGRLNYTLISIFQSR